MIPYRGPQLDKGNKSNKADNNERRMGKAKGCRGQRQPDGDIVQ